MATATPWGAAQFSEPVAHGLTWYAAARHGGLRVAPTRAARMPAMSHRHAAREDRDGALWFEEDSAWALVALVFPGAMIDDYLIALGVVLDWYPEVYEAYTGQALVEGQSLMRDKAVQAERHADDFVAVAALRSEQRPGMVEVTAARGGRREHQAQRAEFLVPANAYDPHQTRIGFVLGDGSAYERIA